MVVKLHNTTRNLESTVTDALSILSELRDECQEQYDGMPESFQSGSKGETLQSAIDALDEFCDESPEFPSCLDEVQATWAENRRKNLTRAARAGNAASMLSGAFDALGEWLGADDNEEHEDRDVVQQLSDDVESWMSASESLEF